MSRKEKGQAYEFVDVHTFTPSYSADNEEEFSVYIPLMCGETSEHYQPEDALSVAKIEELRSSRDKFSDFFNNVLSHTSTKEMSPRAKMKAVICSASIKAAEISLWTTYSLVHLSIQEKIRIVKNGELGFSKDSLLLGEDAINKERNEIPQDFRLIQIRLRWKENGRRKSAWSKINPITPKSWFKVVDNSNYVECIKRRSPFEIPKLILPEGVSDLSVNRMARMKYEWERIISDRHEIARLAAEVNGFSAEAAKHFFLRDYVSHDLDYLIGLESLIPEAPTLDNLLDTPHMNLAMRFSKYEEENEVQFSTEPFELKNISFEPVIYDLADNQPNILVKDESEQEENDIPF